MLPFRFKRNKKEVETALERSRELEKREKELEPLKELQDDDMEFQREAKKARKFLKRAGDKIRSKKMARTQ